MRPLLYFKNDTAWREWLHENHKTSAGVDLVFYRVESEQESMRWEEAVRVAICYGWIDSTVRKIDDERRKQYFCPRKPKSVWSKVNKQHIEDLIAADLMHESGHAIIALAKENGSWTELDDMENGIIPADLQEAFDANPAAFKNYENFARGYRKSYLYWLNQAKRETTRQTRITEIIKLCEANVKTRG